MIEQESLLYKSALVWSKLCNEKLRITYGYKRTLYCVEISFQPEQFFHLAGFQYTTDVAEIPRLNSRRILSEVLNGNITQDMVQNAEKYEKIIKPRLESLSNLDNILVNDFTLFSYRPRLYNFYAQIKADFLISAHHQDTSFVFIIREGQTDIYLCCSTFVQSDSRNYEQNQRSYTILKKEIFDCKSGKWTALYNRLDSKEKK